MKGSEIKGTKMGLGTPLTFAQGVMATLITVLCIGILYGTMEVHERLRDLETRAWILEVIRGGDAIQPLDAASVPAAVENGIGVEEPDVELIEYKGRTAELRNGLISGGSRNFYYIVNSAGIIEAAFCRRYPTSAETLRRLRGEPLDAEPHGQPNTGDEPVSLDAQQSASGPTALRVVLTNTSDEVLRAMPVYAFANLFIETPSELRLNYAPATRDLEIVEMAPGESFEVELDIAVLSESAVGRNGLYKCNLIYDPGFIRADAHLQTTTGRVKSNVFYLVVRDHQVIGIEWPEIDESE